MIIKNLTMKKIFLIPNNPENQAHQEYRGLDRQTVKFIVK